MLPLITSVLREDHVQCTDVLTLTDRSDLERSTKLVLDWATTEAFHARELSPTLLYPELFR